MSNISSSPGQAGAAVYNNASKWYDLLVLSISNTWAWGCPTTSTQLPFYQRHIGGWNRGYDDSQNRKEIEQQKWLQEKSQEEEDEVKQEHQVRRKEIRHLEIGVGSGYYVRHTNWSFYPSWWSGADGRLLVQTKLTLMDLNVYTLEFGKHMASLSEDYTEDKKSLTVDCIQHDVMQPLSQARTISGSSSSSSTQQQSKSEATPKFDSVSLFFLFHCLPTTDKKEKLQILINLKCWLATSTNPDAVIYGTTILGKGVRHNWFGRLLIWLYNRHKIFDNYEDEKHAFAQVLRENYEHVELEVVGRVLMFVASRPRNTA